MASFTLMAVSGQLGLDGSNHLEVIPGIKQLISRFDEQKLPVFFTRLAWKSDYSDCGRLLGKMAALKDMQGFVADSCDADMVDDLSPADHPHIIEKTRSSAFWKTNLEDRLIEMKVDQVVVTGVG